MAKPQEQIVDALETAAAAVKEAKVPKDLRVAAFKAVLAGMKVSGDDGSGAAGEATSILSPVHEGGSPGGAEHESGPAATSDQFGKIASKLKCGVDAVKLVFDIDEAGVHLLVARNSLDPKPAAAQQEIALLLLAGRQGAGLEEWTTAKLVRDAAHDLGAYNKNHSTYVGELQGPRMRIRGKRQSRELKLNQPGFAEAAALVSRLVEPAA